MDGISVLQTCCIIQISATPDGDVYGLDSQGRTWILHYKSVDKKWIWELLAESPVLETRGR